MSPSIRVVTEVTVVTVVTVACSGGQWYLNGGGRGVTQQLWQW
jgi:hypothetical protein